MNEKLSVIGVPIVHLRRWLQQIRIEWSKSSQEDPFNPFDTIKDTQLTFEEIAFRFIYEHQAKRIKLCGPK